MSEAFAFPATLGAASEARLAAAFAEALTITAQACAQLLGVDVKALRAMDQSGLIGGVIIGAGTRRYTEADVRAYLLGAPALPRAANPRGIPCRSTKAPRQAVTGSTTSSRTSEGFTARRARLTVVAPPKSKKT